MLVTVIVKSAVEVRLPSLAWTVIVWLAAELISVLLATVTTPLVEPIVKRPPALFVRLNVTVPPAGSVETAVIPTVVPFAEFTMMVLPAASPSTGTLGARFVTLTAMSCTVVRPLPSLAVTCTL